MLITVRIFASPAALLCVIPIATIFSQFLSASACTSVDKPFQLSSGISADSFVISFHFFACCLLEPFLWLSSLLSSFFPFIPFSPFSPFFRFSFLPRESLSSLSLRLSGACSLCHSFDLVQQLHNKKQDNTPRSTFFLSGSTHVAASSVVQCPNHF